MDRQGRERAAPIREKFITQQKESWLRTGETSSCERKNVAARNQRSSLARQKESCCAEEAKLRREREKLAAQESSSGAQTERVGAREKKLPCCARKKEACRAKRKVCRAKRKLREQREFVARGEVVALRKRSRCRAAGSHTKKIVALRREGEKKFVAHKETVAARRKEVCCAAKRKVACDQRESCRARKTRETGAEERLSVWVEVVARQEEFQSS